MNCNLPKDLKKDKDLRFFPKECVETKKYSDLYLE